MGQVEVNEINKEIKNFRFGFRHGGREVDMFNNPYVRLRLLYLDQSGKVETTTTDIGLKYCVDSPTKALYETNDAQKSKWGELYCPRKLNFDHNLQGGAA